MASFPPVVYLSLSESSPNKNDDDNKESHIRRSSHIDGLILGITHHAVKESRTPSSSSIAPVLPVLHHRFLLQRKLRHTATGGDIYVGFVLQDEDDHVTTPDNEVQVVQVRMESVREDDDGGPSARASPEKKKHRPDDKDKVSSSSSLWETAIDPGFRALQWLHDQLLLRLDETTAGHDSNNRDYLICTLYKVDLSPHLLLAKNELHAVCVSPRRSNAQSLTDVLAGYNDDSHNESSSSPHHQLLLTEVSVKSLFRDILTGLKTLHGMGVCHRNINADTIVVLSHHNNSKNDPVGMCALVSGLESCRTFSEASERPPINQTPQCVPPEVWKGTMTTMNETTTTTTTATPQQQQQQHDAGQREDLWAAGVILSMLLIQAPLFGAPLLTDIAYQNVLHARRNDDDDDTTTTTTATTTRFPLSNNAALELLHSMLAENPNDRLTLDQIWHHEWLSSLTKQTPNQVE